MSQEGFDRELDRLKRRFRKVLNAHAYKDFVKYLDDRNLVMAEYILNQERTSGFTVRVSALGRIREKASSKEEFTDKVYRIIDNDPMFLEILHDWSRLLYGNSKLVEKLFGHRLAGL